MGERTISSERINVSDHGAIIPYELLHAIRRTKKDLTQTIVTGPPGNKRHLRVEFFEKTGAGLVVPMAYLASNPTWLRDDRRSKPAPLRSDFSGTLRPPQKAVCKKALTALRSTGAATLVLPTGAGKTVTALYIAASLGVKPLIMVHKGFLASQWKERIHQYLPGATVSLIQGSTYDTSADIVIGMIQTFVKRGYSTPPEAGLLIVDECHHIAASVFKKLMWKASQRFILGLSATPSRADGLDIFKLIGQPITPDDNLPTVVMDGVFSPPPPPPVARYSAEKVTALIYPFYSPRYATETPPVTRMGDISYTAMVSTLVEDHARTSKIIDLVESHDMLRGKDTLILSHRRAHCEEIHAECVRRGLDAALFLAPKSKRRHDNYTPPDSTIIISTYAYVSEAFDVPRLECLVLATPASSIEQACGRVMRRMEDPSHRPVILDIVDRWSLFNAQASKRRAFFRKRQFTISNILPDQADRVAPPVNGHRQQSNLLFIAE